LFILLPVILNLRASLEQSLQSRLQAAATIGVMESSAARHKILVGNWDLVMFQSIVAGSIAGGTSCALAWLFHDGHEANLARIVLMLMVAVAASLAAASLSLAFSYTGMTLSRYLGRDVAFIMGPASAAVGSSLLLVCLAGLASFFHWWISGWIGFGLAFGGGVFGFGAVFFFYRRARGNEAVRSLASEGWTPLILGLIIAGVSGLLLEKFISLYKHSMVLYLPIFNGVSGNIGGFYCGEAVRNLHLFQLNPKLPRKTALTLLILANPLHILLVLLVSWVNAERLASLRGLWPPVLVFLVAYLGFSNAHMLLLIALADGLIKLFWRWRMKPDAHAANLMATTGDLAGTLLLASVFYCMQATGSISDTDAFNDGPSAPSSMVLQEGHRLASGAP
jgi:cation transporter-like permease